MSHTDTQTRYRRCHFQQGKLHFEAWAPNDLVSLYANVRIRDLSGDWVVRSMTTDVLDEPVLRTKAEKRPAMYPIAEILD